MRATHHLRQPSLSNAFPLTRRGVALGWVSPCQQEERAIPPKQQWRQLQAVPLPAALRDRLPRHASAIARAHRTMAAIVAGDAPSALFATDRDSPFDLTTISTDDHDQQAIEKLYFQAWDGEAPLGEVWCKVSWLSFHDQDASLRFRFSFGTEGVEDVAADPARQRLAAELCQQLFPESAAVTDHPALLAQLQPILGLEKIAFVERIIYFNAPNGGALFHHDVEPGHAGVIYAQLSGRTFWLALSKQALMEEIQQFAAHHAIDIPLSNLADQLNQTEHPQLEAIIDHNPEFIHRLVSRGYGYMLNPGDLLLLAQRDEEECVWHSVFCLGDEPGEGLSFAMRESA